MNENTGSSSSQQIKTNVHRRLLETIDLTEARRMPREQLQRECSQRIDTLLNEQGRPLSSPEKQELLREVMDEVFGLGPIETLLRDGTVTDVLVNGFNQVYVERFGRLSLTDVVFRDDAHVLAVIQRIAARIGCRIDESSPMLDARLADGSRVNAVISPLTLDGPAMSIRRFGANPIGISDLLRLHSVVDPIAEFLKACVHARLNILLSGGTGSGKTTLLNVLSKWIPATERVVTIEDAAELQLQRDHVVRLETRPPNTEGKGQVGQRELLRNFGVSSVTSDLELDGSADYKLLDRKVVDVFRQLPERSLFFRGLVEWVGFRSTRITFDVAPRSHGDSKWGPWRLVSYALNSVISFSTRPLKIVSLLCGVSFALSFFAGGKVLFDWTTGQSKEGFPTVILLSIAFGNAVLLSLAFIIWYLAKIYEEVKQRPRYVVAERTGLAVPELQVGQVDSAGQQG
jgi:energy-coupling factor transporter ATP-binding protein EcfA2